MQDENNLTKVLYMHERVKFLPVADVWDEYLRRQGLSEDWYEEIEKLKKSNCKPCVSSYENKGE